MHAHAFEVRARREQAASAAAAAAPTHGAEGAVDGEAGEGRVGLAELAPLAPPAQAVLGGGGADALLLVLEQALVPRPPTGGCIVVEGGQGRSRGARGRAARLQVHVARQLGEAARGAVPSGRVEGNLSTRGPRQPRPSPRLETVKVLIFLCGAAMGPWRVQLCPSREVARPKRRSSPRNQRRTWEPLKWLLP